MRRYMNPIVDSYDDEMLKISHERLAEEIAYVYLILNHVRIMYDVDDVDLQTAVDNKLKLYGYDNM